MLVRRVVCINNVHSWQWNANYAEGLETDPSAELRPERGERWSAAMGRKLTGIFSNLGEFLNHV